MKFPDTNKITDEDVSELYDKGILRLIYRQPSRRLPIGGKHREEFFIKIVITDFFDPEKRKATLTRVNASTFSKLKS